MWVLISLLGITSGIVLVVVLVVKVKEAKESRKRRTVATPYGVLMGPTDEELRWTREAHPANALQVKILTTEKIEEGVENGGETDG